MKLKSFVSSFLVCMMMVVVCGTARMQEAPSQEVKLVKSVYQEEDSHVFIPQVTGLADGTLQSMINSNLKTAVLSQKNEGLGSTLHGDFAVSFYNGGLLGIHFWGDSFTPGMAHPRKIDYGIHVDMSDGKIYLLNDLFKPGTDFTARIKALCAANDRGYRIQTDGLAKNWTNAMFTASWNGDGRAFLLDAKSMRVYSIPSYAVGPISGYNVPYTDLADSIEQDGELWKKLTVNERRTVTLSVEGHWMLDGNTLNTGGKQSRNDASRADLPENNELGFPVVMTIEAVGGRNSATVPETIEIVSGDYFKVVLHAAGGTGYSWVFKREGSGLVEVVADNVIPLSDQLNTPPLAGGPVKWEYYFHAKPETIGQETLRFQLIRPWEKVKKPAQTFDLTVITK